MVIMTQIDQREKTLVFCATQNHALAVRDLVNQMKISKAPNYCRRVTADDGELAADPTLTGTSWNAPHVTPSRIQRFNVPVSTWRRVGSAPSSVPAGAHEP